MVSTGIKSLDNVITGLQLGDNVVWQIDSVVDYIDFIGPFVKKATQDKRKLVYIRFAKHPPLLKKRVDTSIYKLNPAVGFESFSSQINNIIKKEGEGVFYVFDCLSDLLFAWSNDLMIGNFFKITCPFLFELNTIAYFSLLRNSHSFKTVARIRDTTQLLIDVYRYDGNCYIHPLKVWNRYTPTMFLPHIRDNGRFIPIANSVDTARLFSSIFKKGAKSATRKLDYWDKLFMDAEGLSAKKGLQVKKYKKMIDQVCKIVIARDDKMLKLAKKYFTLDDFLSIKSRMIGTGFIGGKSVGMLIARNVLLKDKSIEAEKFFEPHDSFYIGSDVFYTYIVENGWWKSRMEQKTKEGYFRVGRELKEKLLSGVFPEEIKEQFQQMIEYYGQSPIIVRSSSLLEDGYGNAFAGKYESIFLANQGTPEQRYAKFMEAVRRIYASSMNEDALVYRLQRGLDQMDEQMALLVQRVSGAYNKEYFFPDIGGVGMSYNAFVWDKSLDPKAGMLRLVLGLGTRAVNRTEGDYPRIVALDQPLLKAHMAAQDPQRFSQHNLDLINTKDNTLQTVAVRDLIKRSIDIKLGLLASKDHETTRKLQDIGSKEEAWAITFDNLFSHGKFKETMQNMLSVLQEAYEYPVDIEFTVNFKKDGQFQINLLQCRPMQTKGLGRRVAIPREIPSEKILFHSNGNFLGGNIAQKIDILIYVDPLSYFNLASQSAKYDIARAIGELNRHLVGNNDTKIMLLGPGRWGSSMPSLGIPVSFSEINKVSVLGEIASSDNNAMPEISFGTHFFQDLIEGGIFYLALFPQGGKEVLSRDILSLAPNTFKNAAPQYAKYEDVIKVLDISRHGLKLIADIITQQVICYME